MDSGPGRAMRLRWSAAGRVGDALERPRRLEPSSDRLPERRIELRAIGANPRPDGRRAGNLPLGGIVRIDPERIDVEAADHLAALGIEHRVREADPLLEVTLVHLEVAEV